MDNKRIPEEFENYARICSNIIGTHFKGRTNSQLEKILVGLTRTRDQMIDEDSVDSVFMVKMIDSFIDGIRGKKPPGF